MDDPLAALSLLERRYDGPIPPEIRLSARFGSSAEGLRVRAAAEARFFTTLARGQIDAIRTSRKANQPDRAPCGTLRLYLAERRRFRRIARQ